MYKQTDPVYQRIMLGNGVGSIYQYGCYEVSLCNGLNQKGYGFTPESLNNFLKSPNAWVGPYNNYIDVLNLNKYFPDVFLSFQQIDPWNDVPSGADLIKNNLVVLGRVSAVPIGGTGDHYVLITGIENGVCIIFDPWSGVEELITKRWGNAGNILGIRIFEIKPYVAQTAPTPPPASPAPAKPPVISGDMPIIQFGSATVVLNIYRALCGVDPSPDEIKARVEEIALGKPPSSVMEDTLRGDVRAYNRWLKPAIDTAIAALPVPVPNLANASSLDLIKEIGNRLNPLAK